MKTLTKLTIAKRDDEILLINPDRNEIIGEIFGEGYSISPGRAEENANRITEAFNAFYKRQPEPKRDKTVYYLLKIEERNGEQCYNQNSVIEFDVKSKRASAEARLLVKRAEYEVKNWYADAHPKNYDGVWHFFGGSLTAELQSTHKLTKEEYDILNKYR